MASSGVRSVGKNLMKLKFTDKGIIDYNKNKFEVFGNFYLYEELTILSGQNLKGNTNLVLDIDESNS